MESLHDFKNFGDAIHVAASSANYVADGIVLRDRCFFAEGVCRPQVIVQMANQSVSVEEVEQGKEVVPRERSDERYIGRLVDVVGDRRDFVIAADRQTVTEEHQSNWSHVDHETEWRWEILEV